MVSHDDLEPDGLNHLYISRMVYPIINILYLNYKRVNVNIYKKYPTKKQFNCFCKYVKKYVISNKKFNKIKPLEFRERYELNQIKMYQIARCQLSQLLIQFMENKKYQFYYKTERGHLGLVFFRHCCFIFMLTYYLIGNWKKFAIFVNYVKEICVHQEMDKGLVNIAQKLEKQVEKGFLITHWQTRYYDFMTYVKQYQLGSIKLFWNISKLPNENNILLQYLGSCYTYVDDNYKNKNIHGKNGNGKNTGDVNIDTRNDASTIVGSKYLIWRNLMTQKECNYCQKLDKILYKCKKCRFVAYCSVLCQKKDWNLGNHREKCKREKWKQINSFWNYDRPLRDYSSVKQNQQVPQYDLIQRVNAAKK